MTDLLTQADEYERLRNAATEGPYKSGQYMDFIGHAAQSDIVSQLKSEVERLRETLWLAWLFIGDNAEEIAEDDCQCDEIREDARRLCELLEQLKLGNNNG